MPRRGENIYKRKDGRWEARYISMRSPDGKAHYKSIYGKTYSEVREKLHALPTCPSTGPSSNSNLTVEEVLNHYLLSKQSKIKASTFARYQNLARQHILPMLGSIPLNTLTRNKLEHFSDYLLQSGRLDHSGGLSPKTVADILMLVKSAIKSIDFSDVNHILDFELPKQRKLKIETFSAKEAVKMVNLLRKNSCSSDAAILLALLTGIRLGELCALQWTDIDACDSTICISKTAQRVYTKGQTQLLVQAPKTVTSYRTIPLQHELLQILLSWRKPDYQGLYCFTNTNVPLEPRTMQYRFKRFLELNHFSVRNFHALRHSFATRCISQGMDAKCLSEILGHSNVQTTLQLYVHPSLEEKREAIQHCSILSSA